MFKKIRKVVKVAMCATTIVGSAVYAENSVHLGNNQRTGYFKGNIETPLYLQWLHKSQYKPKQAWDEPKWEVQRIDFDYIYQTVSDGERVYFGSSADHKVYALNINDGGLCWEFFTEGPVRLAPTVANGQVFVTSDDGFLYCLDGKTGKCIWKFLGGPCDERLMGNEQMTSRWAGRSGVLIDGNKIYTTFGMWSRDGVYIYCLNLDDGSIFWKNSTANFHYTKVPHGEGMAGVSPQGHLALYKDTLVIATGRAEPIMLNTNTGKLIYHKSLGISHGGATLFATNDYLFFPCGNRASKPVDAKVPARPSLDKYYDDMCLFSLSIPNGERGALLCPAYKAVVANNKMIFAMSIGPGISYQNRDKEKCGNFIGSANVDDIIAGPQLPENAPNHEVKKAKFAFLSSILKWKVPCGRVYAMIQTDNKIFIGSEGYIAAFNASNGDSLWYAKTQGDPRDLNIVNGNLIASTTEGYIYCFGKNKPEKEALVQEIEKKDIKSESLKDEVAKILNETNIKEGYCLVLGVGDGNLIAELAKQSELTIYCIEPDVKKANKVRKQIDLAGLYGTRINIHHKITKNLPYVDYFANLIIVNSDLKNWQAKDIYRVLRPYGGKLYANNSAVDWLKSSGAIENEIQNSTPFTGIIRGELPGAGEWTHQYATAGRTSASKDTIVRLPLKMLWWGKPGAGEMIARHWRAPSPIFSQGRLFTQGENIIYAQDAYNGRVLWTKKLTNSARYPHAYRGGNICADKQYVYALEGIECLQIDAATGKTIKKFSVPMELTKLKTLEKELYPIDKIGDVPESMKKKGGKVKRERPGYKTGYKPVPKGYYDNIRYDIPVPKGAEWDYLAVFNNVLVGTVAIPNLTFGWWRRAFPEGKLLFAYDIKTGKLLWTYKPNGSIDPNGISLNENSAFVIDRTSLAEITRLERKKEKVNFYISLKSFDLKTGELIWENDKIAENMKSIWRRDDILLLSLLPPSGSLGGIKRTNPKFCMEKSAMQAYSTNDGKMIWEHKKMMHISSPVITSDTIYTRQGFFELRTGKMLNRTNPLTGIPELWTFWGVKTLCAANSGGENIMLHRALSLAAQDMKKDTGLHYYPNVRPGCWLNTIVAGGMVLAPESSSSCQCSFNYKTSVAMIPTKTYESWGTYLPMPPNKEPQPQRVKHIRINVGAPGDKRDNQKQLWFALPRQRDKLGGPQSRPFIFDVPVTRDCLTNLFRLNADETPIAETEMPWIYTSHSIGNIKLVSTLQPAEEESQKYTLTLHFAELAEKSIGERLFNVKVNGKEILSSFDIIEKAGNVKKAINIKFNGIETVEGKITLELEKIKDEPTICGFELILE